MAELFLNSKLPLPLTAQIDDLSSLTGIDSPVLRILLSLLIAIPIGSIHKNVFIKQGFPLFVRHLVSSIIGFSACFFNYGSDTIYMVATILGSYLVLKICSRSVAGTVGFVYNVTLMLFAYYIVNTEKYDMNVSIPLSVLLLRTIGLCFDYSDFSDNGKNTASALKDAPTLIETFGYCFSFFGCLVGPQYSFSLYSRYTSGALFRSKIKGKSVEKVPSSFIPAMKKILVAVMYLAVTHVGRMFFATDLWTAPYFITKYSFAEKVFYLTASAKFVMLKYFGVWLLAEAACISSGIAFSGYKDDGEPSFDSLTNIRPLAYERATRLGHIIENFNINTNQWVKTHIFKRLIFLRNKKLSSIGSLLFLSIWHGLYEGYFLCFLSEFVFMETENFLHEKIIRHFSNGIRKFKNPLLLNFLLIVEFITGYLITNIVLGYAIVSFELKRAIYILPIWNSLLFFAHVAAFFVLGFSFVIPHSKKEKSS